MQELHAKRVRFSHVRLFFDSLNVKKRAKTSDTSDYCLMITDQNNQNIRINCKYFLLH